MTTLQEEIDELLAWFKKEKEKGLVSMNVSCYTPNEIMEYLETGKIPIKIPDEQLIRELNIMNRAIDNKKFIFREGVTFDI